MSCPSRSDADIIGGGPGHDEPGTQFQLELELRDAVARRHRLPLEPLAVGDRARAPPLPPSPPPPPPPHRNPGETAGVPLSGHCDNHKIQGYLCSVEGLYLEELLFVDLPVAILVNLRHAAPPC